MMDIQTQAEIMEKRGEFCLADMLREIAAEEALRVKKIEKARIKAENVTLTDIDF